MSGALVVVAENFARSETVAVLAPTGRDGSLAERVLGRWSIAVKPYRTMKALSDAVRAGVGAVILAEECLVDGARDELLRGARCAADVVGRAHHRLDGGGRVVARDRLRRRGRSRRAGT